MYTASLQVVISAMHLDLVYNTVASDSLETFSDDDHSHTNAENLHLESLQVPIGVLVIRYQPPLRYRCQSSCSQSTCTTSLTAQVAAD